MAALEPKQQLLRPFERDPQLDLHAMTEEYQRYGHRLEPHIADTAKICWDALDAGKHRALRGRAGHPARPRPRHLSVRHLVEPGRGLGLRRRRRRADRHRRGLGRLQGLHDPGRRRAVPDRARRRARRPPARPGPRVRHDHRARAPLRLARPGRACATRRASTGSRRSRSPSSTSSPGSTRSASRSATAARRARCSTSSPTTRRSSTAPSAEYEELPGFDGGHRRLPHASTTCRRAARDYIALHRGPRGRAGPAGGRRPRPRADDLDAARMPHALPK